MSRAVSLTWLLLATASLAHAQEEEPLPLAERRRAVREGTHVFRRILADAELAPLDSFDALALAPNKSVLIILGDLDVLDKVPGGLEKFVQAGGAVLLASDRAVSSATARRQLIRTAGVTIQTETVICSEPAFCYRQIEYCPLLSAWRPPEPRLFMHQDVESLLSVATNTPSMLIPRYLRLDPPTLRLPVMATLPLNCKVETPRGPVPAIPPYSVIPGTTSPDPRDIRNYPAFMVGGDVGAGRALVLADHSISINEMMLPTNNQNVEFTYNAINWLKGDGTRDRALFVEEGRIETKFDLPVKSGSIPPEEALRLLWERRNALLVKVEEKLTQLEDEGAYSNAVIDWLSRRGFPPTRLVYWGAAIGSAVLFVLIVFRLALRHRFRHDTTAPSLVVAVSGNFPSRPLVEQRNQALLRGNKLNEPAGALARHWFSQLGIDVLAGSDPPPFRVAGTWGERRRLARRLRALWELASGRSTTPVGAPQMWKLQREMEQLRVARERGQWDIDGSKVARPLTAGARTRSGG